MNLPIIGETSEAKALRELDERIERMADDDKRAIGACIDDLDCILKQFDHNVRVLAVLYVSRAMAMRFRESQNAEAQQRPN
jgi:hypothetical protein